MIIIKRPFVEYADGFCYYKARIIDEDHNFDDFVWYRTTEDYSHAFCVEIADSFAVLMLLPAIYTKQDIYIESALSEATYYNLSSSLVYLFSAVYGVEKQIQIHSQQLVKPDYHPKAIACGCSLGIDSMSAILRHVSTDCPSSFCLTYLTFFNIGALGEHNFDESHSAFIKNLEIVNKFAAEISLPVFTLESNSSVLFSDFDFEQTHSIRNAAAVLSVQRFIKRYFYASSYPVNIIKLSNSSLSYFDTLVLPLLSTENTHLLVTDADKDRVKKTKYVSDSALSYKYLYVCWKDIFSNGNVEYAKQMSAIPYLNCSRCDKCLRTMLTLDILGKLDMYLKSATELQVSLYRLSQ